MQSKIVKYFIQIKKCNRSTCKLVFRCFPYQDVLIITRQHKDLHVPRVINTDPTEGQLIFQPSRTSRSLRNSKYCQSVNIAQHQQHPALLFLIDSFEGLLKGFVSKKKALSGLTWPYKALIPTNGLRTQHSLNMLYLDGAF